VKSSDVGARFSASKGAPGSGDLYVAEVRGFDYFNTRTGAIESGDTTKIAMWLLDTDYDGRSLYPARSSSPWPTKTKAGPSSPGI
jgi:hypothetical protein